MGLVARRRVVEPYETWPNMKAAAETRLWDALTLAAGDTERGAGAIYLMGYVAEILLKTAYCEFAKLAPNDPVYPFLRASAAATHNLTGLLNILINTRITTGVPLDPVFAGNLIRHIDTIQSHCEVTMRYYDFAATAYEVEEVFASVEWIRRNYDLLWR